MEKLGEPDQEEAERIGKKYEPRMRKVMQRIQNVGFALVVLLMVMVLYFDLVKNLSLPGR